LGLLENRLNYVGARDKTVKVKITINTARMILAHDKSEQGALCAVAEAAESLSNEWHVVSPSQNVLIFRRKVLSKPSPNSPQSKSQLTQSPNCYVYVMLRFNSIWCGSLPNRACAFCATVAGRANAAFLTATMTKEKFLKRMDAPNERVA